MRASGCSQVVILAGGMGTRLAAATGGLPKALVPVCGRPVLERQLVLARDHGVGRALLLLGHGAERIVDWLQTQPVPGLEIDWRVEWFHGHGHPAGIGTVRLRGRRQDLAREERAIQRSSGQS